MSVVGIDLGTTNTVVACVRGGKVHVLADETGNRLLPSIVSFHPNGEVLTGNAAKQRRVIDPKNTIANHKRIIGHSWNSPELVEARQRSPFELREGPGQGALVHVRGQDYTLPEVSAFVLKRARQIAEIALGEPVERAVITVPAHFNELQRASTKVAGRISGVDVMRILNEPTAAALAYGLGRGGAERVAIYDFGGGTFDCTLLDLNGNVFEVLASAGDSFLGGDDVDSAIAERMADYILKTYRFDARTDTSAFERLKVAGEQLKMTLSTKEEGQIRLDEFGFGVGGAPLNVQFSMKRKELEGLITPLVERSFKVTQDALSLARLSPSSFDRVILVGGSTRIPLVRARVESFFGGKPMDKLNPDEVVAVGAAIQAAALVDASRRREIPAPPPLPGTAPRTMRGTGPGAEFDDSTEGNTLARGEPPVTGSGLPTQQQKKVTAPPGQRGSNPPGKVSQVPGRGSNPPGKVSQVPGRGSNPPNKISQPPGRSGSQPPGFRAPASSTGSSPATTQPRPANQLAQTQQTGPTAAAPGTEAQAEDPSLASFPDLVSSPFEWEANASTLTANVDPEALAAKAGGRPNENTMTAQLDPMPSRGLPSSGDRFGAMDEPPSLVSTSTAAAAPNTVGRAPFDDQPSGAFGQVKDLSLVSSTGLSATQEAPAPKRPLKVDPRSEPGTFGHVADDLSLVSTSAERSSPSIQSIPSIQERTAPLPPGEDGDATQARAVRGGGAVVGGRTVQMQGVPPPQHTPQPFAPIAPIAPAARTQMGSPPPLPQGAIARAPQDQGRSQPPPPVRTTTERGVGGAQAPAVGRTTAGMQGQAPPMNATQQSPQHISSMPPANAYPSNAPSMGGFSGFGSDPPPGPPQTQAQQQQHTLQQSQMHQQQMQGPGPAQPAPQQAPVFSGYQQQQAQYPGGGFPNTHPPGGTFPPGMGGAGGSPFGGTTEPPMTAGALQQAAHSLQANSLGGPAPVLVDVTPRGLIVETAGGYSDTIIPRNSKIPCERMRKFSTSRDGQTIVRIRVAQGENSRFSENTFLGEVELGGLRVAGRGDVTVAVSFELDADGTLRVRAWDTITLQEARATLQLIGMADESSVVMMINRFAQQPMGPSQ